MGKVKDYFTRESANEGVKIPLVNPRTGNKKEDWIKIRGVDSDEFREANLKNSRRLIDIAKLKTDKAKKEAERKGRIELIASLIISWSFDMPCNDESKIELLTNAPRIADIVDSMSMVDALFIEKKRGKLKSTPNRNSNSRKSQRVKKSVGGNNSAN